jgi:hypothetical protein
MHAERAIILGIALANPKKIFSDKTKTRYTMYTACFLVGIVGIADSSKSFLASDTLKNLAAVYIP